jgi:EAL domain-containing protein (putative c-di-GMP-specific phosphodiesterase class I)
MRSSTIARAAPRMLVQAPPTAPAVRGRRVLAATAVSTSRSTPAGMHRRPWLARLRRALAEDRFALHFQPIVALCDLRVSHHEALVRLADEPDGRLVAPARFLPAAERYGLIRELDRRVLERVIALLGDPDAAPPPAAGESPARIAVNLSALSVADPGMLGYLERRLALYGVEPARLIVEVTETASITDMPRARAFCAGVQELGCAVALDDFGTGLGSLQYLKHLPFRYLKIDGEFVRGLADSRSDQLLVKALADVVRGMGGETIAEFVSDPSLLPLLAQFGVDYAQGYALGAPRLQPAAPPPPAASAPLHVARLRAPAERASRR